MVVAVEEIRESIRSALDVMKTQRVQAGRFADAEYEHGGLIMTCQGLCAFLVPAAAGILEIDPNLRTLLIDELNKIVNLVDTRGASALSVDPYLENVSKMAPLMTDGKEPLYIDTLSWLVSTVVHARYGLKSEAEANPDLFEKMDVLLEKCLSWYIDTHIEGEGWTWGPDKTASSDLFFTWTAVESLNDVGDYVLGESRREIGVSEDIKFIEGFKRWDELRNCKEETLMWLIQNYLPKLQQPLRGDNILSDKTTLIYNNFFVLDMLILLGADEKDPRNRLLMQQCIEPLLKMFDESLSSFKSDPQKRIFKFEFPIGEMFDAKALKAKGIPQYSTSGIFALVMRTLSLLDLYEVTEIPDKESRFEDLYRLILVDRNESPKYKGVWDSFSYSVALTERAIEAFVDYYDILPRLRPRGKEINFAIEAESLISALQECKPLVDAIAERVKESMELSDFSAKLNKLKEDLLDALDDRLKRHIVKEHSPAEVLSNIERETKRGSAKKGDKK